MSLLTSSSGWVRETAAVFVAALALALPFQGSRGLYETSEGRYAECAREMVVSGAYAVPRLWGEAHLTKPPLTYWCIAGGIRLLGRNAWGVRLYGAVAFALTAACTYVIGRRLWTRRAGCLSAAIVATAPLPFIAANTATTDTLLCAWETAAMMCLALAWRAPRNRAVRLWIVAMWSCWGLAFLTKGPPALLPLAAVLAWRYRRNDVRVPLFSLGGLAAFACIGLSWFIWLSLSGAATLHDLVRREVVGRMVSDNVHNRAWWKAVVVYTPPLLFGLGLWAMPGAAAVVRARLWRLRAYLERNATPACSLLRWWILLPLAVFAVSRSRLPLYIAPLMVPMALALAVALTAAWTPATRRWTLIIAAVSALTLVAGKAVAARLDQTRDMRELASVCRAVARPGESVWQIDRSRMHGLRFYLDGNLGRLAFVREAGSDQVRPFLNALARGEVTGGDAAVLVVHDTYQRCMRAAADTRGLRIESSGACKGWQVWRVARQVEPAPGL